MTEPRPFPVLDEGVTVDLTGLPKPIQRSGRKLARYARSHWVPRTQQEWAELPDEIGIPAEHLWVLMDRVFKAARH